MNETMGKAQFWLYMIGFNLTFFPMHFLGVQGMPRRIFTYAGDQGWNLWNFVCTMGAYITAIGGLLFFFNLIYSLLRGEKAAADPWDGRTLEWTIPSPPEEYNFAIEPEVHHLDDFWHRKYGKDGRRQALPKEPHVDTSKIHMPNPSFWPIILALGLTTIAAGMFFHGFGVYISLTGVAVALLSTYGWVYEKA